MQGEKAAPSDDMVWKIALAIVCVAILVIGFFYPKKVSPSLGYLIGYSVPNALLVWLVFYATVTRKRSNKTSGVSFLVILIAIVLSVVVGAPR